MMAILAYILYRQRLEILVYMLPKVLAFTKPIQSNQPVPWTKGPSVPTAPPDERPPNIILFLADDMGYNDVSLYNGGAAGGSVMTPNIDKLAASGVKFMNGYAGNAVCAPSRASIMTGRYGTRFGFEFTPFPPVGATLARWGDQVEKAKLPVIIHEEALQLLPANPLQTLGMPASEVTIAEILRDAGYYTAHIGKWHLGHFEGANPHEQGFVDSLNMAGVAYDHEDSPNVVNAKLESMIDKMCWASAQYAVDFNGGKPFHPSTYLTDYYTDEAVKVIEEHKHHPFFLYLAHWAVHNPLQAKKSDYDALSQIKDHAMRVYGAMIVALDRSLGRVLQALEDNGLTENTFIVFTADNGAAAYLGLQGLNAPFRGWKLNHFEGGYHVPYAAQWPSKIKPGTVFNESISHTDLLPTLAAVAGASSQVPTDRVIDGVNWLPFVLGEEQGEVHKTLFWKEGHHQSVQHQGWKLIRSGRPVKQWLFHLAEDPTEKHNLLETKTEKAAELETLLDSYCASLPQPAWPCVLELPQLIDRASLQPGKTVKEGDEYIYWPN